MATRRKRPVEVTDLPAFMADVERMHKTILGYCMNLRTGGAHYRAIQNLHEALLKTAMEVTGEEVPWVRRSSSGPAFPTYRLE
jgi:hypothetical protein